MGYTAIIDYNVGNLLSVTNAFKYLGFESRITNDLKELELADDVVLPGVGAFPDAMKNLKDRGLDKIVKQLALKKPILGVCLGMQMLFDSSEELRYTKGLGLIGGTVQKINTQLKLPQIGWNSLKMINETPLLKDVGEGEYVYFVHSYSAIVADREDLKAVTEYPDEITAVVARGNVFGCQFHPEKSGEVGLRILKNFKELEK